MSPGETGQRAALFSVRELVTDAPNGQHQLWVLRVIFDLCSQAIDVRINCPVVPFIRIIPNLLEQILAREDAARVRGEQAQQIEFLGCEVNMPVGDSNLATYGIDSQIAADDRRFIAPASRGRAGTG